MADDTGFRKAIKTGDVDKVKVFLEKNPYKVSTCCYDIVGAIGYSISCGSKCHLVTKTLFNKFKSQKFPIGNTETGKTTKIPLSEHHEIMQKWTCEMTASEEKDDVDMFKYFLGKYCGDNIGEILSTVASAGNAKCLSVCFNKNNATRFSQTDMDNALICSSLCTSIPCAKILMKRNANPCVPNADGMTAFQACCDNTSPELSKCLTKCLPKTVRTATVPAGISKAAKGKKTLSKK